MRLLTLALGCAMSWIGRLLAWPGQALGNAGVWVMNLYCPCELCQEASKERNDGR